jgi:hypothetical protein
MPRSPQFSCALVILCLGAAYLPAQQPEMIPPPIPSVLPPEPPDPDTLPPPPRLEWEPLGPKGSEEAEGGTVGIIVPPPLTEVPVEPPPPPMVETPVAGLPDPSEMELAKPEVEIWRESSEWPQVPARTSNRLDKAYVTGTEPVWLRVQFDPQAAGKTVYVKPGPGITISPSEGFLTVPSTGECVVQAQFMEGLTRGHVVFYCEGVKTVLPVARAPLAKVEENEVETGGGH